MNRKKSENAVIFIGAGVLSRSSWLDRQIFENFNEPKFWVDYPWGEVVQKIAEPAAQWRSQVIIEVPPGDEIRKTLQYQKLTQGDEQWTASRSTVALMVNGFSFPTAKDTARFIIARKSGNT